MGGASDPRIMSMEELENYARQFEGGEDINLYDVCPLIFAICRNKRMAN
jgi:DNA excision repair protein ERCC-5